MKKIFNIEILIDNESADMIIRTFENQLTETDLINLLDLVMSDEINLKLYTILGQIVKKVK